MAEEQTNINPQAPVIDRPQFTELPAEPQVDIFSLPVAETPTQQEKYPKGEHEVFDNVRNFQLSFMRERATSRILESPSSISARDLTILRGAIMVEGEPSQGLTMNEFEELQEVAKDGSFDPIQKDRLEELNSMYENEANLHLETAANTIAESEPETQYKIKTTVDAVYASLDNRLAEAQHLLTTADSDIKVPKLPVVTDYVRDNSGKGWDVPNYSMTERLLEKAGHQERTLRQDAVRELVEKRLARMSALADNEVQKAFRDGRFEDINPDLFKEVGIDSQGNVIETEATSGDWLSWAEAHDVAEFAQKTVTQTMLQQTIAKKVETSSQLVRDPEKDEKTHKQLGKLTQTEQVINGVNDFLEATKLLSERVYYKMSDIPEESSTGEVKAGTTEEMRRKHTRPEDIKAGIADSTIDLSQPTDKDSKTKEGVDLKDIAQAQEEAAILNEEIQEADWKDAKQVNRLIMKKHRAEAKLDKLRAQLAHQEGRIDEAALYEESADQSLKSAAEIEERLKAS